MGKSNRKINLSYSVAIVLALLGASCSEKREVMLPKSNSSMITQIGEYSPVYIFFKKTGKDTLADLNRNNTISSTDWVFNIDKRLPLRLVVPHLIKMKAKKEGSMHKSETAQSYFSYADSVHKKLAFLSFTEINYMLEKPRKGVSVFFGKNNTIWVDDVKIRREEFRNYISQYLLSKKLEVFFCFAENLSFGEYLQNKVFLETIKKKGQEDMFTSHYEHIF